MTPWCTQILVSMLLQKVLRFLAAQLFTSILLKAACALTDRLEMFQGQPEPLL